MNARTRVVLLILIAMPFIVRADELGASRKAASEIKKKLAAATKVEILSLHAGEPDGPLPEEDSKVKFHGYAVLGSLDITGAPERTVLVSELASAIARSPLRIAACFFPRHGIRAELKNGRRLDLLICFECSTVFLYESDKSVRLNIDDKPEGLLNSLIQKAGIRQGPSARGPGV